MRLLKSRCLVVVCGLVTVLSASDGFAQKLSEENQLVSQVKKANAAALARCQSAVLAGRKHVINSGSKERFRKLATVLISGDHKLNVAADYVQSKKAPDRILLAFRQNVFDERNLAQGLAAQFERLQSQLMEETRQLYARAGISKAIVDKAFPLYGVDTRPWTHALNPVLAEARQAASKDWERFAGVAIGSVAISEGITGLAQELGLWEPESGLESFFVKAATEFVAETALDEVTNPTTEVTEQLQRRYLAAQRQIIDGQSGFAVACKFITDIHVLARCKHLGVSVKGGE